jgi:hypothetical protein
MMISSFLLAVGGVTHTWINANNDEEPLEVGSGEGMRLEANLPRLFCSWECSELLVDTIILDLGHSKFTYN